jgi:hypothetical protein
LGLASLSTSDYTRLSALLGPLLDWTESRYVNFRCRACASTIFPGNCSNRSSRVRKSGLTFAPEAGTQRLRDIINKNITEHDILEGCRTAFSGGYTAVKLYFMMGFRRRRWTTSKGIAELAQKVVDLYYAMPERPKGKAVS